MNYTEGLFNLSKDRKKNRFIAFLLLETYGLTRE